MIIMYNNITVILSGACLSQTKYSAGPLEVTKIKKKVTKSNNNWTISRNPVKTNVIVLVLKF